MLSSDSVRLALDASPDALVFIDTDGHIVFANRQVRSLFGYEPDGLKGQPIESLLPQRFRDRHLNHRRSYFDSLRLRPMGIGLDLFALRSDGTEFPVEISLSPMDSEGRTLVAAAIRDATERRKVEAELKHLRSDAERANLAKSRFLATASHDLRQPLQVLAMLNAALRRHVEPAGAEALREQEHAITAMSRLLNALLDISKLESGAVKPDITDFEVSTLFAEMRVEFAALAASKGLDFSVHADDGTRIHTDAALVSQALKNLLANAIKYTQRGWVRMTSTLAGDVVRIEVRDSGIGIPEEQLPLIFDEFYQVGVSTHGPKDGYGLGLSIVQRVATLLGLKIHIESVPGQGSTFAIDVPASRISDAIGRPQPDRARTLPAAARPALRILVVDDDAAVRKATSMFLRSEGYDVRVAECKAQALELMGADPQIDVLITDYHLDAGNTGLEVVSACRILRGTRHLPAILLSGDTSTAIRAIGGDPDLRVTSKPIDPDRLLDLVTELRGSLGESPPT
jgi:PAS domain S-box-containing protein